MTKQAELLPAWMHPQNNMPPVYGDGECFRPVNEHWLDPADDNAIYIANGYGYFEGLNGKCVREHPSHTLSLIVPKPHSEEYSRYISLELHCWVLGDEDMNKIWLQNELLTRDVNINTCRIGLKTSKTARYEVMAVTGLTTEIYNEIEALIQQAQTKRQEHNAQWSKEQRLKYREVSLSHLEQEQQINMTNKRDLITDWQTAFELARKHGIPDDRVHALWKQTASPGDEPALTEDNMDLLHKFILNEIEVKQAQENTQIVRADNSNIEQSTTDKTTISGDVQDNPNGNNQADEPLEQSSVADIEEVDGYKINKNTGEIVSIDSDAAQEIIGPMPQEMRQGTSFVIQDARSVRWFIKRVRSKQREIEEAERDLKVNKNQFEVLKNRCLNEIKGLRFIFNHQPLNWLTSNLPIIKSGSKAGQFRKKSLVYLEGTLKLKTTGGLKCIDKDKFERWWADLPESEKQMYPHKVTYTMNLTHITSCLNNGIEIPGFINEPINPAGDWEVTVSTPPKKNKNASTIMDDIEEVDDEEVIEDEEAA